VRRFLILLFLATRVFAQHAHEAAPQAAIAINPGLGDLHWKVTTANAEAQSFFQVLQQAMAGIALTAFGWIAGPLGVHAYFASAAFAALGAVLIFVSMRLMAPKNQGAGAHA